MRVETFLVCDSVEHAADGKYITHGVRREFVVPRVPYRSQPTALAIYVALNQNERGHHKVTYSVKSAKGEEAIDSYEFSAEFLGDYISYVHKDVLRFASAGRYTARLTVDGRPMATWGFEVKILKVA